MGQARVVLLTGSDLAETRRVHATGKRPSALPYGAEALEAAGYTVLGQTVGAGKGVAKVRDVVEHRLGFPVERTLRALPQIARSQVAIGILEIETVAASALKRLKIPPYRRAPLIALTCWLAEEVAEADAVGRAALLKRYSHVDVFVYWSTNQTQILLDLGIPEHKLLPVGFGVDADFFMPHADNPRDGTPVAIGLDGGRDYTTMYEAVAGSEHRIDLVCPLAYVPDGAPPENIELVGTVEHPEYAKLLREASVVVVPTHERAYPTGQSVALEAAASGACVIATGTVPLREYFTDGVNAILVPPRDPGALRAALDRALGDAALRAELGANARRLVEQRFTTQIMWRDIVAGLCERGVLHQPER